MKNESGLGFLNFRLVLAWIISVALSACSEPHGFSCLEDSDSLKSELVFQVLSGVSDEHLLHTVAAYQDRRVLYYRPDQNRKKFDLPSVRIDDAVRKRLPDDSVLCSVEFTLIGSRELGYSKIVGDGQSSYIIPVEKYSGSFSFNHIVTERGEGRHYNWDFSEAEAAIAARRRLYKNHHDALWDSMLECERCAHQIRQEERGVPLFSIKDDE